MQGVGFGRSHAELPTLEPDHLNALGISERLQGRLGRSNERLVSAISEYCQDEQSRETQEHRAPREAPFPSPPDGVFGSGLRRKFEHLAAAIGVFFRRHWKTGRKSLRGCVARRHWIVISRRRGIRIASRAPW